MVSPNNPLLKYGNYATQTAALPASGVNVAALDPVLREAYTDFIKTGSSLRKKTKPSESNILADVDLLSNLSKPVPKKPGLLQQLLGNKVTQTALAPLQVLDIPRRAVISGAKELYDVGAGKGASFQDFASQVRDPSFGVGKFVNTGNRNLDRLLGFGGDVLADPLTYVTLGAGKFAGASGRLALATDLAAKGASEAIVQKAGIRGLTGLTAAERAAYDLPRAGLYLGGAQGVRIPGTEAIGEVVGRGLSKTRAGLGATEVGGKLRRARSDARFLDLTEKLLAGKGPAASATGAAKVYGAITQRKGTEGLVLAELRQDFRKVADTIRSAPDAVAVTKALEKGATDSSPAAGAVRSLFDNWFNRMKTAGVQVDGLDNYVPHVWTDEGRALFASTDKFAEDARKLFGVTVNELRAPSAVRHRVFRVRPGELYEIGGKQLSFADNSVDEINRVFQREFGVKVLEDDINILVDRYANNVARAIGNQRFATALADAGLGGKIDQFGVDVVDTAATKVRDEKWLKVNKKFLDDQKKQRVAAKAEYDRLVKPYTDSLAAFKGKVKDILKQRKVVLQGDLKNVIADVTKFVSENQKKQFDLATQAKLLDDAIVRTERAIEVATVAQEEAVRRASMVSGREGLDPLLFPEVSKIVAERDAAAAVLAELKEARNQLAMVIPQVEQTLVKLPVISQMPEQARQALKGRDAIVDVDEAGNAVVKQADVAAPKQTIEPYRIVDGNEVEYRIRNQYEQFRYSYRDAGKMAGKYSPEAGQLVEDARRISDDAHSLDLRHKVLVTEMNQVGNVRAAYDATKRRYDYIYGALINRLDKRVNDSAAQAAARMRAIRLGTATGAEFPAKFAVSAKTLAPLIDDMSSGDIVRISAAFNGMSGAMKKRVFGSAENASKFEKLLQLRNTAQYEGLWNIGKEELSKYVNKNGYEVIRRFEIDINPQYKALDQLYERRNAMLDELGVSSIEEAEVAVQRKFDTADALMRQAKSRAVFQYADAIESPLLGQALKNQMVSEYASFFDRFINSMDLMRRINSKEIFSDETARAWAVQAVAAKDGLDEAISRVRIHADFANRYKNVAMVLDSKGLPYDRNGLGALVAKEVLATEIGNLRSAKGSLIEAQSRAIQEGVDALRRAESVGKPSTLDIVKEGVAQSLDAKTNVVQTLVGDWLRVRRELGDVTRTSTLKLTKEQKAQQDVLKAAVAAAKTPKEQAAASKALYDFNSKFKKTIDVRGVSAEEAATLGVDFADVAGMGLNVPGPGSSSALRKEMRDLEDLITRAIFGEESVRPEDYSFTKFIDSVTAVVEGEGNVRRFEPGKLNAWINENGLPEISKKDIGKIRATMEVDPKTGVYRSRTSKTGVQSRVATVAKSIADQVAAIDQRIESLVGSARLLGLEPKLPKIDEEMLAKYPEFFEFTRIGNDPVAMSEKLAELELRRNELKPRALPSNTKAGIAQPTGLIDEVDSRIEDLTERLQRAGARLRYKPTVADRKRMFELNTTIDFLEAGLASGKIKGNRELREAALAGKRGVPGDRIMQVRAALDEARAELADVEARSWFFSGKQESLELFEQLKDARAYREKLITEYNRIGDATSGEIAYWRAKLKYAGTDVKPKAGFAVEKWQDVLFAKNLATAKRPERMFLKDRLDLLAQEVRLRQKLRLPNQSALEGRMVEISEAVQNAGGVDVINKRNAELNKYLKDVDAAIAAADPNDKKIVAFGLTVDGLKRERKAIAAELRENDSLRKQISRRGEIEAEIQVGPIPAAQARVDELNKQLVPIESAQYNAEAQLRAATAPSEQADLIGRQSLEFYQGERARVNGEIDNTRRIGEDGAQALLDSKVAVEAEIRELADEMVLADTMPAFSGVGPRRAQQKAEEIRVWMDQAYALVDPEGYASRVAKTAPVDRYGPPSVADELAALGMQPATPETTATLALYGQASKAEAELIRAAENTARIDEMIKGVKNLPSFPAIMKKQIQDGMVELPNTGIAIPKEINDMLERVMHLDDPRNWQGFWKSWEGYTDFFKAYATLSPRFHVRNALSATLMNWADGVTARDMLDGQRYWMMFKNNPNGWLDEIPVGKRKELADAVLAVFGSGGGQYSEFKTGARGTRNFVVQASRDIGTSVEGSVRLGMALNTIRRGGSVDEAVARITRIHFDYSQLSTADTYVRRVIPFWTFMSRNIPLQMQQIWMKPKVYQIYASAVRNFEGEPNQDIVPSWYQEQGVFKSPVGGGYIKPDLAWTGLPNQVRQATTAAGLLSQSTPAVRVPLELLAGKKFFSGAPIREGEQLGYAAESLMPLYNTIRGLTGLKGGAQSYMSEQAQKAAEQSQGAAQWNTILSFLGAPYVTGPTVSQQRGEILRRKALMEELARMVGNK